MSDTIQVVQWALGQQCPLRRGADWYRPATALQALHNLQWYSRLRHKPQYGAGVHGDVCVYSTTSALPGNKTSKYKYPYSGVILSSLFSPFGGLPSLQQLCGDCPANSLQGGLAGCAGTFYQALSSKELQEQLDRLIDRLGLASLLDRCFPQTEPHWFRFWIESPLKPESAKALHQLLEAVYEEDEQEMRNSGATDFRGDHANLGGFVEALQRSIAAQLPMHVSLAAPGHTDFGWYTIFPHCPRCKSEAPVARWKRKYRDEVIVCPVCSHAYSPAATHSATREDWKPERLCEKLGQDEFEKFAKEYLMAQGASEPEAAGIVATHEKWEREEQEKRKQEHEFSKRHDRFLAEVIYGYLKNLSAASDEDEQWLFSPADVEEVFRRCEVHGATVHYISHISESGDNDEYVKVTTARPARQAFQELIDKGCTEKFSLVLKIPRDVVERWWNNHEAQ